MPQSAWREEIWKYFRQFKEILMIGMYRNCGRSADLAGAGEHVIDEVPVAGGLELAGNLQAAGENLTKTGFSNTPSARQERLGEVRRGQVESGGVRGEIPRQVKRPNIPDRQMLNTWLESF